MKVFLAAVTSLASMIVLPEPLRAQVQGQWTSTGD